MCFGLFFAYLIVKNLWKMQFLCFNWHGAVWEGEGGVFSVALIIFLYCECAVCLCLYMKLGGELMASNRRMTSCSETKTIAAGFCVTVNPGRMKSAVVREDKKAWNEAAHSEMSCQKPSTSVLSLPGVGNGSSPLRSVLVRWSEVRSPPPWRPCRQLKHTIGCSFVPLTGGMRDNLGSERMGSPVLLKSFS